MATSSSNENSIVFFIDKKRFTTDQEQLKAGQLLSQFAEEDPADTTLVLKRGNELHKFEDDNEFISLENGMRFLVYYDGPTSVSSYGPEQLVRELRDLGYESELFRAENNQFYAIIRGYVIELGKFAGKVIDLAIPAMPNFPQAVASSIHVQAKPQLYEKTDSVPNVRNIIDSDLGNDWRYWSRNFNWPHQKKTTRRLMALIAGVFENA